MHVLIFLSSDKMKAFLLFGLVVFVLQQTAGIFGSDSDCKCVFGFRSTLDSVYLSILYYLLNQSVPFVFQRFR